MNTSMCTTEEKKKYSSKQDIRFNMKERSVRPRPDVVMVVEDRCRRSQQIATDQWKMLLLHTIETHGEKQQRPRCFDQIIHPNLTIHSIMDARRFLTGEKRCSRLCCAGCGRRERENLNAKLSQREHERPA